MICPDLSAEAEGFPWAVVIAGDRPGPVQPRRDTIDLLCGHFGYQHVTHLGLEPTGHQLIDAVGST